MQTVKQSAICLSIGFILLAALLTGGTPVSLASLEDEVLARVEVTGMLDEIDLPTYAHLQGGDGIDYALAIAPLSELDDGGYSYTVTDMPASSHFIRRSASQLGPAGT